MKFKKAKERFKIILTPIIFMLFVGHIKSLSENFVPPRNLKSFNIGVLIQDNIKEHAYIRAALAFAAESLKPYVAEFGYTMRFVLGSSGYDGCDELSSVGEAAKLINLHDVKALIGPVCSEGCIPAGLIANYENVPIISYGCSSPSLSDPYKYPTFARTKPYARTTPEYLTRIIQNSLSKFKWNQLAIVYSTEERFAETFGIIKDSIDSSNYTTLYPLVPIEAYEFPQIINILKAQSRVVLFICGNDIIAQLLSLAYKEDMHDGKYAFITLDFIYQNEWKKAEWFVNNKAFEGVINIGVKDVKDMENEKLYATFFKRIDLRLQILGYKKKDWNNTMEYSGAVYAYDSVKAYINGIHDALHFEQDRRRAEFLEDTLLNEFLQLNNITLGNLDAINDYVDAEIIRREQEANAAQSASTTASTTTSEPLYPEPVLYEVPLPLTDTIWTICQAETPPDPDADIRGSCACNMSELNVNNTQAACHCSFPTLSKCDVMQHEFKLRTSNTSKASCGCDLYITETIIPHTTVATNASYLNHTLNSVNHTLYNNQTGNATTDTKPNFDIERSLFGNCNCTFPIANDTAKLPDGDIDWVNYNWTFPANWTYTNFTLPQMNYSYEWDIDVEGLMANGHKLMDFIYNSSFTGYSGAVHINHLGDRFPIVVFDNLLRDGPNISYIRIFESDEYTHIIKYTGTDVIWPGGGQEVPLSVPICGWHGEICRPSESVEISNVVLAIIIPFACAVCLFFLYRLYKQHKYEKDLLNQDMLFKFNDGSLEIPALVSKRAHEEMAKKKDSKNSKNKKKHLTDIEIDDNSSEKELIFTDIKSDRKKRMAVPDDVLIDIGNRCHRNNCQIFKGKFRMDSVFIKRINKATVLVERELLIEMKQVRDLKHANLNPYVGFCMGPPYVLICSMWCNKGSLQDILTNPDIQLDWVFRNTFISDIITGLSVLHESEIGLHGHLTSFNICVDNRWNCKLTDYGLTKFKDTSLEVNRVEVAKEDEDGKYEALLWTAPENIVLPVPRKSKEGDIYSLGIIIAEILNRETPFASYKQYSARDFVHFISKRCIPPFRPHVRLQAGLDGRTLDMMRLCWDEFPANRPSLQEIKTTFKNIVKNQESTNLLDNMIEMMEKYAHNLELDCRERTKELMAEKIKSDALFYRALPKSIADKIRKGQDVEAVTVQVASVLIIRIDDFSGFNNDLEAQQVIDILHDVHKVVNNCLEEEENCRLLSFNRDKCVIVCGMPEPIKVKHAHYLARLAVRIMGQLLTFRFRHIQDTDMRFKMALHSGQFNCGIVGLKFPVFSCMGIEIEKAEAMCQHCPPLRIFVSDACKKYLDSSMKTGSYENCGPVLLKGLGVVHGHYLKNIRSLGIKLRNPNSYKPKKSSARSTFAKHL